MARGPLSPPLWFVMVEGGILRCGSFIGKAAKRLNLGGSLIKVCMRVYVWV